MKNSILSRVRPLSIRPIAALVAAILGTSSPALCIANSIVVKNCLDTGTGSLRDAISNAANGDTVDLTQLSCSPITLVAGEIAITKDLSINGRGPQATSIIGNFYSRVFNSTGQYTLNLSGLSISGGGSSAYGGCIRASTAALYNTVVSNCSSSPTSGIARGGDIYTSGNLILDHSQISGGNLEAYTGAAQGGGVFVGGDLDMRYSAITRNVARSDDPKQKGFGGGAFVRGNVSIQSSLIYQNSATNVGGILISGNSLAAANIADSSIVANRASAIVGGIYSGTKLTIDNSTISGNTAATSVVGSGYSAAAGLQLYAATANLQSTIIAKNTANDVESDIGGYDNPTLKGANNLVMQSSLVLPTGTLTSDPLFAPIRVLPRTAVLPLLPGSPAINTGNNVAGNHYDQRGAGYSRVVGTAADMGAYEGQSDGVTTIVSNCANSGAGSLRDTLSKAHSGDTLDLRNLNCPDGKLILTTGELNTSLGNLNLVGPGAALLTIDGNLNGRVLEHNGFGTLALSGLSLAHGYYQAAGEDKGGCIYSVSTLVITTSSFSGCRISGDANQVSGGGIAGNRVSITSSVVSGNSVVAASKSAASRGAGLYASSYLMMNQVTVDGNQSYGGTAGGLYLRPGSTAVISNSTISNNQAVDVGAAILGGVSYISDSTISGNTAEALGGLVTLGAAQISNSTIAFNKASLSTYSTFASGLLSNGPTNVESSIVFGNLSAGTELDVGTGTDAPLISGNHNLIGPSQSAVPVGTLHSDPQLGPLQDNGGPTFTHALKVGSPAIDTGSNVLNLANDQRGMGFRRTSGKAPDIGAFEFQDTVFANGFE